MVGVLASHAYKGYLPQPFLHHPLEIATQEAVDEEDIKGTLVVGHKDIRLPGHQMFAPIDADRQQQKAYPKPRPALSGIVTPEMSVANHAANDGDKRCNHARQQQDWQADNELIESVKILHRP